VNHIPALGIDLGHANVKICWFGQDTEHVEAFPAAPAILSTGRVRELSDGPRADGSVVKVNGVAYFVGPDAEVYMQGTAQKAAQQGYAQSTVYKALMLGALGRAMAKLGVQPGDEADLYCLGLGLPLTTYFSQRESLRSEWLGRISVPVGGGTATVKVHEAIVLAQPVGALIARAVTLGASAALELSETNSLVLDAGGGTLDYLTTARGVKINSERSGAVPEGMDACTVAVAKAFGGDDAEDWQANPHTLRIINSAIARAAPIRLGGVVVESKEYLPVVQGVVRGGVDAALKRIGSTSDIGLVLVVGGGGEIYAEEFRARVPRLATAVHVEQKPLFTNVRGFYYQAKRKADSLMRSLRVSEGAAA
jgi:PRTRC genetic system protein D